MPPPPPAGDEGPEPTIRITRLAVLGFRNLVAQELELEPGLTLLWGANGAGKTNVLEAVCLALTGSSCRTRNEREAIAFDQNIARVEVEVRGGGKAHRLLWSLSRAGERRHLVDGRDWAEPGDVRPTVAIFLPDRLTLVKGPPAGRRAHLDRVVAALWPPRAAARRRYGRALAQRNALLGRVRAAAVRGDSLDAWERELAAAGVELANGRRAAVSALAPGFRAAADELGLGAEAELRYMPRSDAREPGELAAELLARRERDLARGHTTHGPHLDEVGISLDGRSLRRFGSQGEQRTALLALLFAERRALLEARRPPPLLLLDDVMSELDPDRRGLLARWLAKGGGQVLLTAAEPRRRPADWPCAELAMRRGSAARSRPGDASAAEAVRAPVAA